MAVAIPAVLNAEVKIFSGAVMEASNNQLPTDGEVAEYKAIEINSIKPVEILPVI